MGKGYGAVAAGILFQAATFGSTVYSFTFFVLPLGETFSVTRAEVMVVPLLMSLGIGVLSPLVGVLLDSWPIRRVILVGMLLFSSGLLVASIAREFWQVVAAFGLLVGPGMTFAGPMSAQVLVTRSVPLERRGLAVGWVVTGTSIGGILMPPITSILIETLGWRVAAASIGPLTAAILTPLALLMITPQAPYTTANNSRTTPSWSVASILRDPAFWTPVILLVPAMAAFASVQANLDPFGREIGFAPGETSLMMSTIAGIMIASKIWIGHLTDRFRAENLAAILIVCLAGGLGLLATASTLPAALAACLLFGLASGGFLPLLAAMLASRYGEARFGMALGLAMPFTTLAGFGPIVSGWVYDQFDRYPPVLAILAGLCLAGVLLGTILRSGSSGRAYQP